MGKSTISNQFKRLGFKVFDADEVVHQLYACNGKAVELINKVYPDVIVNQTVSRPLLMNKIMNDDQHNNTVLKTIEGIVHPLVAQERGRFYDRACNNGELMVIYDIPLLFENNLQSLVDYVIVATANEEEQKKRVLRRHNMNEDKFKSILAKQIPDSIKRQQADFIVSTDYPGYTEGKSQIAGIIESIIGLRPDLWKQWKDRLILLSSNNDNSRGVGVCDNNHNEDVNIDASDSVVKNGDPLTIEVSTVSALQPQESIVGNSNASDDVMSVVDEDDDDDDGSESLHNYLDMIVFDLDDTLVPVTNQLLLAYQQLSDHMTITMPQTSAVIKERLQEVMKK
jgi:dephospho-CoA kinase